MSVFLSEPRYHLRQTDNRPGACASTLTLIVAGVLVLVVAGFYEVRTKRDALFPPIAFRDRTIGEYPINSGRGTLLTIVVVITLATTFLHNFAFNAGTFYLALYFQVSQLCFSSADV